MMIGLPGAGKTTYAKKQLAEKPEKRYYILGQDMVMGHLRNAAVRRYKLKYVEHNYRARYRLRENQAFILENIYF